MESERNPPPCDRAAARSERGLAVARPGPERRKLIVEAGSLLVLHPDGPAGGFPMAACVDRVADGRHWFLGSCEPLRRGDPLIVECPVPDDARYVSHARVDACSKETFALRIDPTWERAQQREFVRISAHGLEVRVVPVVPELHASEDGGAGGDEGEIHPLLDISAGGIRFESRREFEPGDEVVCHFELPGTSCFVLPARIVRAQSGPLEHLAKSEIAVAFEDLDERSRSLLLRWVYREQVSRHREERRADARRRD